MIILKTWRAAPVIILCVAICVTAGASLGKSSSASNVATGAQDVVNLDRRISSLEQRLYSIESNLNRLEQQFRLSQRATTTTPASGDELELSLLRGEIETLRHRLSEIECVLVKLDERTIARVAGAARQRRAGAVSSSSTTDPCHLNADAPLRFSTRP